MDSHAFRYHPTLSALFAVIPAQAGIHSSLCNSPSLEPGARILFNVLSLRSLRLLAARRMDPRLRGDDSEEGNNNGKNSDESHDSKESNDSGKIL